jgi:hypothetical protein
LTIQLFGIRLFNASASALALMLAGYYQNSLTLLRDLLETGFLLHYFAIDRSKINEWKCSDETTRHKNFRPVIIRQHFDKLPGEFLKLKSGFLNNVKSWGERFLGVNLKDAKLEEINELIRCI